MHVTLRQGLLFGGVHDLEGARHSMSSTFFNDLFAFDMEVRTGLTLSRHTSNQPTNPPTNGLPILLCSASGGLHWA